jgi:hypothetical protein
LKLPKIAWQWPVGVLRQGALAFSSWVPAEVSAVSVVKTLQQASMVALQQASMVALQQASVVALQQASMVALQQVFPPMEGFEEQLQALLSLQPQPWQLLALGLVEPQPWQLLALGLV